MKCKALLQHNTDQVYQHGGCRYFSLANNRHAADNEDALLVATGKQGSHLLLVADGMGGHPGGDEAARMIVDTFGQNYGRAHKISFDQKLFSILDQCNQTVIEAEKDCGSTLCMGLVDQESAQFVCVGDSLGIVLNKSGKVKYATFEENSVAMADEIGVNPQESFLLNYVGFERISYQVSPKIALQEGDQVFLMTDGAHEFFEQGDEKDISSFMYKLIDLRKDHVMDDATAICFTRSC